MKANESLEEIKNDLVQVAEPNPTDLAEIVKRVVGSTPLREFGAKAGMSAATLSRIMNGKITRPLNVETLMNIVVSSDTSGKEMVNLYEEIAMANGMTSKSIQKKVFAEMEMEKQRNYHQSRAKKLMFMILLTTLAERGNWFNRQKDDLDLDGQGGYLKNITEIGLHYDTGMDIRYKEENYTWILWLFPYSEESYPSGNFDPKRIANQLVRELSPVFLADSWKPELYADAKLTFCFANEALFECFCNALSGAKLNNRFSAILIDLNGIRYSKEELFHSANYPNTISLFSLPKVLSITDDISDVAEEITENEFIIYDEENGEE